MRRSEFSFLMKKETIYFSRVIKFFNSFIIYNQKILNHFCRTVTSTNQYYLRRRLIEDTKFYKILIFGDNHIIEFFTKFPDFFIISFIQIMKFRVGRIRKIFFHDFRKGVRKICVKKKLQSDSQQGSFSIRKISKTSGYIFLCQFWKFFKNFIYCHSRSKVIKNIEYCDSQTSNTWFSKSFARFYSYNISVIYHIVRKPHLSKFVNIYFNQPQGANP